MEPIISIKNLSVVYDKGTLAEVTALSNVTMNIYPGEFVIVFGPSGCGKSTLLYAISGAERRMTSGELWIKGKNLRELEGEEMISFHRQSVGMVFQAYNLIPTVNVFDNIILPLVFRGVPKKDRMAKGKELVEKFKIGHLAKMRPNLLSGGQQQRIGIARALVNDTDIILADEPTGNLDSQSAFVAMDMFTDLNLNNKKTIILVTHEDQYLPYASRIVYMKDGKVVKDERQERKKIDHTVPLHEHGEGLAMNIDRLVVFLELSLGDEERLRFNETVKSFITKKTDKEKLGSFLDLSFKDGGVGLHKHTAVRIAQELESMLQLSDFICKDKNNDSKNKSEIVFNWIFSDYKGEFSALQEKIVKEAIIKRLKGVYSLPEFQSELDRPLNEKGAGLNFSTAKNAAQKIGLIF